MSHNQTPLSIEQIKQAAYFAGVMTDVHDFITENANPRRVSDLETSALELADELRIIACKNIENMTVPSAYPQSHAQEA